MPQCRIAKARHARPRDIPDTMKAAAVDRFGPPSALILHELPTPRPGPHEVLIAIDTARASTRWSCGPEQTVLIFGATGAVGTMAHRRLDREHVLGRMVLQVRRRRVT